MKSVIVSSSLVLAVLAGCSVDTSRLRASASPETDAAADVSNVSDDGPTTKDLGASADADALLLGHDAEDSNRDTLPAPDQRIPTDAIVDFDVIFADDVPESDDIPGNEAGTAPDTLPPPPDTPEILPDLPQASLEVEPPLPDGAADGDTGSGTDDTNAAPDLMLPSDAADTGGRTNGSVCTSADQCESGFCVGSPGRCCVQSCNSVCYRPNQCSTGTCVPTQGTVTCSELDALCGLAVSDPINAGDWSIQANLQNGDLALGSDDSRFSEVPSELVGSPWIRPSRLSKSAMANPLVTFSVSAAVDVYVGIDTRVSTPSWLTSWTDSGMTISYRSYSSSGPPTTVRQRLFQMRFPAGSVALGPLACINPSNCSMYITVIRFADQPAGVTPSCGF
jgi:hypothetical protein